MNLMTVPLQVRGGHTAYTCDPQWSWDSPNNLRDGLLVWLIAQGEGCIRTPDREYPLRSGDAFVFRMHQRHIATHNPRRPLVVHAVHFDMLDTQGKPFLPSWEALPRYRNLPVMYLAKELADRSLLAYRNEPSDQPLAAHWLRSCLLLLEEEDKQARIAATQDQYAASLAEITQSMREHPQESYPTSSLAQRLFCSPDHFIRIFKRAYGTTPADYLIQCRVDAAKRLLRYSSHSIGNIAIQLGYNDPYFFSKQFRQRTGMSPRQYRTQGKRLEA